MGLPRHKKLLVLALVLAGVASGVAAFIADPGPPTAQAGSLVPTTPVLSLRRVPDFLSRQVAAANLSATLTGRLADPALAGASSCLAVSDDRGRPVFEHQPETDLIPASTVKLATATAAVELLGADFRYITEVRATARSGAVVSDLWFVGSGDPILATADFAAVAGPLGTPRLATSLEALADAVVAAGVTRVTGSVVGDESRYDKQRYVPTWNPSYATTPEIGPQSALTVNDGFTPLPNPRPSTAPATTAAAVLTALLVERGVSVAGPAGEGTTPPEAVGLARVESPPMAEILTALVANSSNLTAELVTKELGVRFGDGGTTGAGTAVTVRTLAEIGLPTEDLVMIDGSGLDRGNRLDCVLLQAILARLDPADPADALARSMAVAGVQGTMARRLVGTDAAGKVAAKTGSLEGVVGLSGFAPSLDGQVLRFSLVANGLPSARVGVDLGDAIALSLVAHPVVPDPASLGPTPVAEAGLLAIPVLEG